MREKSNKYIFSYLILIIRLDIQNHKQKVILLIKKVVPLLHHLLRFKNKSQMFPMRGVEKDCVMWWVVMLMVLGSSLH